MKEQPNKEKVIRGLECLAQMNEPMANPCSKCGYHDRPNFAFCVKDIASDAIVLLKEQKAKKPIYNAEKYGDYLPHCSSCEKVLPNRAQYGKVKFCHNCGKAVKWND